MIVFFEYVSFIQTTKIRSKKDKIKSFTFDNYEASESNRCNSDDCLSILKMSDSPSQRASYLLPHAVCSGSIDDYPVGKQRD